MPASIENFNKANCLSNKRPNWSSLCITNNSNEAFTNYIKNNGAFIHSFNVDDKRYYHALKQGYKTNMENENPIYNQILQQEQIELHKLMMIVKNNNGTVLDAYLKVMNYHLN